MKQEKEERTISINNCFQKASHRPYHFFIPILFRSIIHFLHFRSTVSSKHSSKSLVFHFFTLFPLFPFSRPSHPLWDSEKKERATVEEDHFVSSRTRRGETCAAHTRVPLFLPHPPVPLLAYLVFS